jgi:hypothetical protein
MMNLKKSKMIISIEFFESQKPEQIENQLRYAVEKKIIPPFRDLDIMIDYKNLRQIPSTPLIINREELKELRNEDV